MSILNQVTENTPLPEKIALIEKAIQTEYFADRVIPCCMACDADLTGPARKWQTTDFAGSALPRFRDQDVTGADWLNHENSTSFSGEYLFSQALRYQVTQDAQSLEECSRALRAIRRVSQLAEEANRFGWLCKPWGEVLRNSSSPDQNVCAITGMWHYLPYAPQEEADWIRAIIPAIAAYWEKIDYTIEFGDHIWSMHNDTGHMRMYVMFNLLAAQITGKDSFRQVAERLEKRYGDISVDSISLFDTYRGNDPGYFDNWRQTKEFAGATMLFAPLQMNIQLQLTPERKKRYLCAWQKTFEHGLIGYDEELRCHYYDTMVQYHSGKYFWKPMPPEWPSLTHQQLLDYPDWAFNAYPHRICWADATARLPLNYLLYLRHGGEELPKISRIVREIMTRLDYTRLHWMIDFHHDQTVPEIDYMLHGLTSEIPNYVAAYYLGCQLGFWSR